MSSNSSARRTYHAPTGSREAASGIQEGAPIGALAAMWMGLPWLELWARGWEAWCEQLRQAVPPLEAPSASERRRPPVPWVPQVDASVIPFRRRDDSPGVEATRWTLRLHLPGPPWLGASSNVIAIDTMLPRAREADSES